MSNLANVDKPAALNCYILMVNGDPDFKLKARSARAGGKRAEYIPEGWVYEKKEDAEEIAERWTCGKRKIVVRAWFNSQVNDIWHGSKISADIARKKISHGLNFNKNSEEKRQIEQECDCRGLHHSWLYCEELPEEMSDLENQLHKVYKPLWNQTVEKLEHLKLREEDIKLLEEDSKENIPDYVYRLNLTHAVIHHNKTNILTEKKDPVFEKVSFSLESVDSFHNWYKPHKDKNGQQISKKWLEHPQRREYPGGIVFNPKVKGHYDGFYNLFQGFSVEAKKGDCGFFWELVFEALSAGCQETYVYIRKWLAHMIQNPSELAEVALAFRGLQGTGKGTFMNYIGKLVSPHYLELAQTGQVVGRFNSHLKDLILVYANEALWGGNKSEVGVLKAMITDKHQAIEQKGIDIVQVRNCKRVVLSSNEDWIAPMDIDDRRFLVVDVIPKFKEDDRYFAKLRLQMEQQDGLNALMYDLQNEDINNWHPRKKPNSGSGFDLKLNSMKTPHLWLYECLFKGRYMTEPEEDSAWIEHSHPRKDRIYNDYKLYCETKHKSPENERIFWRLLKQILGNLEESRPQELGIRFRIVSLPSLTQARDLFAKFAKENGQDLWEE